MSKEAEKLRKYEDQEVKLAGRNSYSKTDPDATFMRMKNDTLRAAYNVQISTSNQFIVNYSVSQNASDSASFPAHLQKIVNRGEKFIPDSLTGDCGYGNLENYSLLDKYGIKNYLKFSTFHYEQRRKFRENRFHRDNMRYDKDKDRYYCPSGKPLVFKDTCIRKTSTGFHSHERIYQCQDCSICLFAQDCKKGDSNRTVRVNLELERYKDRARENLNSERGLKLRKRRGNEVETPFADFRKNQKFDRFSLRGEDKVDHELGLMSLAFNIRKYSKMIKN